MIGLFANEVVSSVTCMIKKWNGGRR